MCGYHLSPLTTRAIAILFSFVIFAPIANAQSVVFTPDEMIAQGQPTYSGNMPQDRSGEYDHGSIYRPGGAPVLPLPHQMRAAKARATAPAPAYPQYEMQPDPYAEPSRQEAASQFAGTRKAIGATSQPGIYDRPQVAVAEPVRQGDVYNATPYEQPYPDIASTQARYNKTRYSYQNRETPWYAGLKLELSWLENYERSNRFRLFGRDFDTSFDSEWDIGTAQAVSAGYRFNQHFRAELEASYRQYEEDEVTITRRVNGSIDSVTTEASDNEFTPITVMANGYFDMPLEAMPALVPYVGGGIGVMTNDNLENENFAYQLMAGLGYELGNGFVLSGGYKFLQSPGYVENSRTEFDATSHNLEFAIRKHF